MQLAARQPDGATLREHLAAVAAQGARADVRLTLKPPPALRALWECFLALHACRPVGMAAGAIPPSEIDAWQRLHGVQLTAWEVETLMAADRAALAAQADAKPRTH